MHQLTETDKRQLQSKIREQQERRLGVTKGESQPGKYAYMGKYVFLGALLCLVALNVELLLSYRYLTVERFGNLGVSLILLFNHLADNVAKPGWQKRLIKIVYWICVFLTFACLSHRFWSPYAAKLTVKFLGG